MYFKTGGRSQNIRFNMCPDFKPYMYWVILFILLILVLRILFLIDSGCGVWIKLCPSTGINFAKY